jgi:hypothetical protein
MGWCSITLLAACGVRLHGVIVRHGTLQMQPGRGAYPGRILLPLPALPEAVWQALTLRMSSSL